MCGDEILYELKDLLKNYGFEDPEVIIRTADKDYIGFDIGEGGIQSFGHMIKKENVEGAKSYKLKNIIFNMKKIIGEIPKVRSSADLIRSSDAFKMICGCIVIFSVIKDMVTVEIREDAANLLILLWQISEGREEISSDYVFSNEQILEAGYSENKLSELLDKLEKLGCIKLKESAIQLKESVTVKR